MDDQLYQSLKDAHKILSRLQSEAASGGMRLFQFMTHASKHVEAQLDELEKDILQPESPLIETLSNIGKTSEGA